MTEQEKADQEKAAAVVKSILDQLLVIGKTVMELHDYVRKELVGD
jgi:hypothetical protein